MYSIIYERGIFPYIHRRRVMEEEQEILERQKIIICAIQSIRNKEALNLIMQVIMGVRESLDESGQ